MKHWRTLFFSVLIFVMGIMLIPAGCGGGAGSNSAAFLSGGGGDGSLTFTGTLSGVITDSSTRQLQAGVAVALGSMTATTDSTGAYVLAGIASGTYTLSAYKDGYLQYSSEVTIQGGGQQKNDIALVPHDIAVSGTLSGRVRDADTGAPLDGVTVAAGDVTRVTSADGAFSFNALPAGSVTVTATNAGYYHYEVVVEIGGGEAQQEDIELLKEAVPSPIPSPSLKPSPSPGGGGTVTTAVLQGTVIIGTSRKPLAGATVTAGSATTMTDLKGFYRILDLKPGTVTVTVRMSGYYPKTEAVTVKSEEQRDLDFAMTVASDAWLEDSTQYKWQVDVVKNDGTTEEGPAWNFTTNPPGTKTVPALDATVNKAGVLTIARSQLLRDGRKAEQVASVHTIYDSEGVHHLAYVAVLSPRGYVVVPAVKMGLYPPVLASSYSTDFSFDRAQGTTLLSLIRSDITLRLLASRDVSTRSGDAAAENSRLWEAYLKGSVRAGKDEEGPQHLMTFEPWDQATPYNDNCPIEGAEKCLTGCTATAVAQLFNFWKYPTTLTFTASDSYVTTRNRIPVDATKAGFSSITYNNGAPDSKVKAQVSLACGVMMRMDYAVKVSLASPKIAQKALETKCGYPYAHYVDIDAGSDAYRQILVDNLALKRPVLMGIRQPDTVPDAGGHSIVCDGYDSVSKKFHLNMGWGNSDSGWYALPEEIPEKFTIVDDLIEKIYTTGDTPERPEKPQNPSPQDQDLKVYNNALLLWDSCKDAKSYNLYLWKAAGEKPSAPTFSNLPYAVAGKEFVK
jgi:hypothetical protein